MKFTTLLVAAGFTIGGTLAHAQITAFSNRADWLSHISPSYSDNFDSGVTVSNPDGSLDRAPIHYSTFSIPRAAIGVGNAQPAGSFITSGFLSWEGELSGVLQLNLGGEYTAFGLDFGQFYADIYPNDVIPFNVDLVGAGGAHRQTNSGYTFIGLISEVPFSVVVLESANIPVIDNLVLGERNRISAVPEPSTYGLIGTAALTALTVARGRRRTLSR